MYLGNPGVYVSHVEASAWPLVAFFATIALGAAAVVAVMLFTANRLRWFRPVSILLAIGITAGLIGTFQSMGEANARYAAVDADAYSAYVDSVQQWLSEEYEITTDTDTVRSLLTRQPETVVAENRVVQARIILDYQSDELDLGMMNQPAIAG